MNDGIRVEISSAHYTHCASDWFWKNDHQRSDYDLVLWFIRSGRGNLRVEDENFPLSSGECFLIPMSSSCHGTHDPGTPLVVPWALFNFVDCDGIPVRWRDAGEVPGLHLGLKDIEFFARLLERAVWLFDQGRREDANRWLLVTLDELLIQDSEPQLTASERIQYGKVQKLCLQIQQDPGRLWRVEDMAQGFHYSRDHFCRLFKRFRGVSPNQYVLQVRIDAAKSMLRMSSNSIADVAETLGYGDVYHFSKQFKEKIGVPPSEYRRL